MPQEPVTGNKTIAKNATMLYLRMFFTMAISFYTSRVVLQALGVSDYGIYNVVGGITILINVFIGALGSSTSRFLTFALGKDNIEKLKLTFSTAAWVHIGLALLFVLVAETIGLWFVNTQLVIPDGRMTAANWVYQASILNVAVGIIQVPYNATITSHEHMSTFAYISIIESLSKLGIVGLLFIISYDTLIIYSILLVALSLSIQVFYRFYCKYHFPECHISGFNLPLFKKMMFFSGWSMVESGTLTLKQQGLSIFLNRFFGTLLNAAAGTASLIQGLLYAFTDNITTAFRPQIIKSFSIKDYKRVEELIGIGTKFTTLVTMLTTIPFIFNMDYIMSLWLVEVPIGAVEICQICLLSNFFISFNPMVGNAVIASGEIKGVSIVLACQNIFFLVLTYYILKITHSYTLGYAIALLSGPISTFIYALKLRRLMQNFSVVSFTLKIYLPLLGVFISSLTIAGVINYLIDSPILSLLTITTICSSFVICMAYLIILDKNMQLQVITLIKSKIKKS